MALKSDLVHAICQEIALQKDYLGSKNLKTIYFGGGTPSLLSADELAKILDTIHQYFSVENEAEITLEANPEDLIPSYLTAIKTLGVNRLSIGIQSFREENLRFLNRNHSSSQALTCISRSQDIGIHNISLDLIYGIPGNELKDLASDIDKAVDTKVNHISAYSLTIEPKTVFGQQRKRVFLRSCQRRCNLKNFYSLGIYWRRRALKLMKHRILPKTNIIRNIIQATGIKNLI